MYEPKIIAGVNVSRVQPNCCLERKRDGIGALVKVVAGNLTQYDRIRTGGDWLSGNDMRLQFGLGERKSSGRICQQLSLNQGQSMRKTCTSRLL